MSEITCLQAARLWDVTPRRVQMYCLQGRIPGARRVGRAWLLPAGAPKPRDPRKTVAAKASPYWPRLLILDGGMMRANSDGEMYSRAADERERRQLEAQIAYMRGDFRTALRCADGVGEEDPSFLSALTLSMSMSITAGDLTRFRESWGRLSSLHASLAAQPEAKMMAELAQGAIAISAYAPKASAAWLTDGVFTGLPAPALPFALYLRGKALLAEGQTGRMQGMMEGALSLYPAGFGIEEAYLYIMLAHACAYQDQMSRARDAFLRAADILLPKGFLTPLAENLSTLLGLGERCLREAYPEQLPKILSLYQNASNAWLEAHNFLTRERAATVLTRRELQVALCVSSGLGNRESAKRLGMSQSTLKGHLESIYQKLNISSRKALRDFVITS